MSEWYEFDVDNESLEECHDRRLLQCPYLDDAEREVLRQLAVATWDGYVCSKTARDSLCKKGLAVRWNGWQILTREGLAVLEILTDELSDQQLKQIKRLKAARNDH